MDFCAKNFDVFLKEVVKNLLREQAKSLICALQYCSPWSFGLNTVAINLSLTMNTMLIGWFGHREACLSHVCFGSGGTVGILQLTLYEVLAVQCWITLLLSGSESRINRPVSSWKLYLTLDTRCFKTGIAFATFTFLGLRKHNSKNPYPAVNQKSAVCYCASEQSAQRLLAKFFLGRLTQTSSPVSWALLSSTI